MEVEIIFTMKGDGEQKKTRTKPGFLRKVCSSLRGLLFFLGNDKFLDLGFLADFGADVVELSPSHLATA